MNKLARHARLLTFLPGDIVIREHQAGDALYVIARGEVSVQDQGQSVDEARSSRLYAGGETIVFSDHTGRAVVTAATTTMLLRISRRDVLALADKDPELKRRLDKFLETSET